MLCSDIIRILEAQSPPEYAMEWDNVGLLVGRKNREVKKIMLAVDATADVCQMAIEGNVDMIITHHPMIFSKVKRVNDDTVLGNKILSLIEAGITCYAMHTNFDTKGGMAKEAAKRLALKNTEVLEETYNGEGLGQIGMLKDAVSLDELAKKVKNVFDIENVTVYGTNSKIVEKIAVCPGSGKSVIDIAIEKKADCLVTGDIGHHDGLDAVEMGLSIIDASHYGIEKLFMKFIYNYLVDFCDDVEIEIVDTGAPFHIV
ncbi:MAG: Nif3-like dinuclear metal center hexameric protein [Lachnospiraceae bacterium]|nr:Nif3-like dinuclear metal center hexameric protein [Lachnospiraceae bacterium]